MDKNRQKTFTKPSALEFYYRAKPRMMQKNQLEQRLVYNNKLIAQIDEMIQKSTASPPTPGKRDKLMKLMAALLH